MNTTTTRTITRPRRIAALAATLIASGLLVVSGAIASPASAATAKPAKLTYDMHW